MDNVDKSVDKLGSRAPHPLQLQGVYMVREGGLEPETPPSQTLQLQGSGNTTPILSAFLSAFIHTTSQ